MNIFNQAICCSILISSLLVGQNKSDKINTLVQEYAQSGHIHGSILVADKGKILYSNSFGLANMEWNIPNEIDTKFRIYSMSKQFTAMLIMQLVKEDKIELNSPISNYLPYYRKDVGEQVTVHHLLTHTHGIAENNNLPSFLVDNPTQELVENYFSNDLDFIPGSQFRYSGLLGYILLGAIIEFVTVEPYEKILQDKILTPLGMKNSYYLDYRKIIQNRASNYTLTDRGYEHRIQAYPVNADGASCLVSTVEDLLLWDQALYTDVLLPEEYLNIILTPQVTEYAPYYYSYGWYIADLEIGAVEKRILYHTGGSANIIFRSVTDNQTVIILNNIRSSRLYNIGIEILNILAE